MLQVSFRVVGIYCYFENLQLPNCTPDSTVKEVMQAITELKPEFSFGSTTLRPGTPSAKEIVTDFNYTYGPNSERPYSSSDPTDGYRDISGSISQNGGVSYVWQYYRSVSGSVNNTVAECKLFNNGQPSFATTPINNNYDRFGSIPDGFNVSTYNLTWRLVALQMSKEKQAMFMAAHADALMKGKA